MIKNHLQKRKDIILSLGFLPSAFVGLEKYLDLLWNSNEEMNLVSRQMSIEELIDNHVIDCLLPLSHFPKGLKKVADFGSGGGMPGVIFALNFPEIEFHLFEKSPKKQIFLTKCKLLAPNLRVQGEISKNLNGFDLVTARAFKPLDVILELSREYFNNQGKYFLLKGRKEKIEEEVVLASKKFKNLKIEVVSLKSPIMEVERHLVLIN